MRRLECNRCRRIKPTEEFNHDSTTPTGYQRKCRACQKAINERYRRQAGQIARFNPESGTKRIHISLPVDWVLLIDDECARSQQSRAEWLRMAIANRLQSHENSS